MGRLVSTMVSEYASVVVDANSHAAMSSVILLTSVYLSTWLWVSMYTGVSVCSAVSSWSSLYSLVLSAHGVATRPPPDSFLMLMHLG